VTYALFDAAYVWNYKLEGHFDVCDGVVDVSVDDYSVGANVPLIFTATYFSST